MSKLALERGWEPASFNRHKAYLSLAYRLGNGVGPVMIAAHGGHGYASAAPAWGSGVPVPVRA